MSASEREAQPRPKPQTPSPSAFSMSDLLASCAAATAVSTPPRRRDAGTEAAVAEEREARRDAA
ncbi:hypothetical protein ACWGI8_02540 [Streptomyces sp. NPDC054841]